MKNMNGKKADEAVLAAVTTLEKDNGVFQRSWRKEKGNWLQNRKNKGFSLRICKENL